MKSMTSNFLLFVNKNHLSDFCYFSGNCPPGMWANFNCFFIPERILAAQKLHPAANFA